MIKGNLLYKLVFILYGYKKHIQQVSVTKNIVKLQV